MASFLDAVKPGNIIKKILFFVFFALITATPFLVMNMDEVGNRVMSEDIAGGAKAWLYTKGMLGAMWTGVGTGLSTIGYTLMNFFNLLVEHRIGTIVFSVIVLIFASVMFSQPVKLLLDIFDLKSGEETPSIISFLIALALTLVLISPIIYIAGGTTITGETWETRNSQDNTSYHNQSSDINGSLEDEMVEAIELT